MGSVLELVNLQTIDDELASARAQAADVDRRLEGDPELVAALDDLGQRDAALSSQRKDQHRLELDVQAADAKIGAEEKRLYGDTIKNPKELRSLQAEIDHLKANRGKIEDVLLPLLDAIEAGTVGRQEQGKVVAQGEARWLAQAQVLRGEAERLAGLVASLEGQRAAHIPSIPAPDLRLYESLRTRKGGAAIAKILASNCARCRVTLPDAVRRRALSSSAVVQCPNCERILTQG